MNIKEIEKIKEAYKSITATGGAEYSVNLLLEHVEQLEQEKEQYGKLLDNIHDFMDRLEVPMGDPDRRVVMYAEKLEQENERLREGLELRMKIELDIAKERLEIAENVLVMEGKIDNSYYTSKDRANLSSLQALINNRQKELDALSKEDRADSGE